MPQIQLDVEFFLFFWYKNSICHSEVSLWLLRCKIRPMKPFSKKIYWRPTWAGTRRHASLAFIIIFDSKCHIFLCNCGCYTWIRQSQARWLAHDWDMHYLEKPYFHSVIYTNVSSRNFYLFTWIVVSDILTRLDLPLPIYNRRFFVDLIEFLTWTIV